MSRLTVLIAVAVISTSTLPSLGGEEVEAWRLADCPANWQPYVAEVRKLIALTDFSGPIAFADRDGVLHDCIDGGLDERSLERAETFLKILPFDREMMLGSDPSKWPGNVCAVTSDRMGHFRLTIINLPTDDPTLSLPMCLRVVKSSWEAMLR